MNRGPERTKAVPFAAVLLAAGFSSRLGRFKPLLDLGGRPLIEHVVSVFHGRGISEIHGVVGHRREEVSPVLDRMDVRVVVNPDFRRGMFTSVAAGARRVSPDRTGFFVMPVDIPLVRPHTLRRLMAAHEEHPRAVLHPCFRGERGHPPLLPAAMIKEIGRWTGPGGLRGLLDATDTPSLSVDVWDRNILFDLDTPADHRELLERWRTYHLPAPEECEAILETLPGPMARRGRRTAEAALRLGEALVTAGVPLDLPLIRAAALLRPLADGGGDPARTGGRRLAEMGFPLVGEVLSAPLDPPRPEGAEIDEAEVVFLADQHVAVSPPVEPSGRERRWSAVRTARRMESRTGKPPGRLPGIDP